MFSLLSVAFLVLLEGVLSLDNAIVLALVVKNLPEVDRKKALTYGVWGAFLFRFLAILGAGVLFKTPWIKLGGGLYLLFLSGSYFFSLSKKEEKTALFAPTKLWSAILAVEIMDIAFSIDSILAAISLSNDFGTILLGGILGIVMMRFAAQMFGKLLVDYPRLETSAYLLVFFIGVKIILATLFGLDFHSIERSETWLFWTVLLVCLLWGFYQQKRGR